METLFVVILAALGMVLAICWHSQAERGDKMTALAIASEECLSSMTKERDEAVAMLAEREKACSALLVEFDVVRQHRDEIIEFAMNACDDAEEATRYRKQKLQSFRSQFNKAAN